MPHEPAFATDPATAAYYDRRAAEYDEWYTGRGLFAERDRPGWEEEVSQVVELVGHLPPVRTLDVACGTGFLTRHLRGFVVGIDQSPAMVAIARARLPRAPAMVGDALHLVGAAGRGLVRRRQDDLVSPGRPPAATRTGPDKWFTVITGALRAW